MTFRKHIFNCFNFQYPLRVNVVEKPVDVPSSDDDVTLFQYPLRVNVVEKR